MAATEATHKHFWHQTLCEQDEKPQGTLTTIDWECVLREMTFEQKALIPR